MVDPFQNLVRHLSRIQAVEEQECVFRKLFRGTGRSRSNFGSEERSEKKAADQREANLCLSHHIGPAPRTRSRRDSLLKVRQQIAEDRSESAYTIMQRSPIQSPIRAPPPAPASPTAMLNKENAPTTTMRFTKGTTAPPQAHARPQSTSQPPLRNTAYTEMTSSSTARASQLPRVRPGAPTPSPRQVARSIASARAPTRGHASDRAAPTTMATRTTAGPSEQMTPRTQSALAPSKRDHPMPPRTKSAVGRPMSIRNGSHTSTGAPRPRSVRGAAPVVVAVAGSGPARARPRSVRGAAAVEPVPLPAKASAGGERPRSIAHRHTAASRAREMANRAALQSRGAAAGEGKDGDASTAVRRPRPASRRFRQVAAGRAGGVNGEEGAKQWCFDDFELGKLLGKGRFGNVYIAKEKKTQYTVALKVLNKAELLDMHAEGQLRREIEIQSELTHANILRLFGFFFDEDRIFLILEFAPGGELYKYLKEECGGRFCEEEAARFVYDLSSALRHCHGKNVIHRDLKPENLLLDANKRLKIADFGWSVHAVSSDRRTTVCGTLDFLSPEMCRRQEYDTRVDLWAVGVLMYEMLYGNAPFEEVSQEATMQRIEEVDLHFPENTDTFYVSSAAKDLIRKLLQRDPTKRIPLTRVLSHPWIVRHVR